MYTSEQDIVAAQIQKHLDAVRRALGIEKPKDYLTPSQMKQEQETVLQSPRENERFHEEPTWQNPYEEPRKLNFIKLYAENRARFFESQASFAKAQARFDHQMNGRYRKN